MYLWWSAQQSHITGRKYGGKKMKARSWKEMTNPIEQNRNKDNTACKITIFHGSQ